MPAILKAISELNVSPFEAAMGRMERRVSQFASGDLRRLGSQLGAVFSVYAVGRFVSSVGQAADELQDLSDVTGVSAEKIQALQILFKENGKQAGDVATVLQRLKQSLEEAAGGNEKAAQSVMKLKINLADVAAGRTDKVLEQIAVAMRNASGDMQMGEAAGNLLGRGYTSLQAVMDALAKQGIDPLTQGFKNLNQIMENDTVRAAANVQNAYDRAARSLKQKAGNFATMFFGGLYAGVQSLGPEGWSGAANKMFGKPESYDPLEARAEYERRQGSEDAIRRAATARRDAAIAAANKWFADASGKVTVGNVTAADQMARIGGFTGGQANPAAQMAERQLRIAELQKQLQEKIAAATEKTATATDRVATTLEE